MFVLPAEAAKRMRASGARHGQLQMARQARDDLWVVTTVQATPASARLPVRPAKGQDTLRFTPDNRYLASWHRTTVETQIQHYRLSMLRGQCLPVEALRRLVPTVTDPRRSRALVVTHCPDVHDLPAPRRLQEFTAWNVAGGEAIPADLAVEPAGYGLGQLEGHWPVDTLARRAVLLVGAGSIGGTVADALAAYGVGRLDLLDPDRLLWHNTVRHVLGDGEIGRHKVDALADRLSARWPRLDARPLPLDVVAHAAFVRAVLPGYDAVVCAADGIAPRRVVSHLARRAGVDAVLTSVLEDGAIGEVLRLRRAPDQGCLLCRRAVLFEDGRMDPERVQERGYGDGDPHRPMTAIGPDLALVGQLAAKVTVAGLLERAGHPDQRLPGEHAVVGLRPRGKYEAPFDVDRAGEVRWHPATPPQPGCVTCSDP